MSSAREIAVLLEQAEAQRSLGNHRGATQLAQRALGLDPDHAASHAVLAVILLDARRLRAAGIEARAALALDGNDGFVHRAAAHVLLAERKLDDAWAHCLVALDGPSATPGAYVLGARIRILQGEHAHALELLEEALALDPGHGDALTELARLALRAGDLAEAAQRIGLALEADPVDRAAHVVAGFIDLARGDTTGAEQHARFVLAQHATSHDGLALWAAIQARRSWLLGAWWRWNLWVSQRDERQRLAALLGTFVAVRVAVILADELGYPGASDALRYAWFGLCAYTWIAPAIFRRMLARSLETVRLDPDF